MGCGGSSIRIRPMDAYLHQADLAGSPRLPSPRKLDSSPTPPSTPTTASPPPPLAKPLSLPSVSSSEVSVSSMVHGRQEAAHFCAIDASRPSRPAEAAVFFLHLHAFLGLAGRLKEVWDAEVTRGFEAAEQVLADPAVPPMLCGLPQSSPQWRQQRLRSSVGVASGEFVAGNDDAFEAAQSAHPVFFQFVRDVAEGAGIDPDGTAFEHEGQAQRYVEVEPLKSRERAVEKAHRRTFAPRSDKSCGPPIAWVMDWCSAAIYVDRLESFGEVWRSFCEHPLVESVRCAQSRFRQPLPPGYQDWNVEFRLRAGELLHICQLQVHFVPLKAAAMSGDLMAHCAFFKSFFQIGRRQSASDAERRMDLLHCVASSAGTCVGDVVQEALVEGGGAIDAVVELLRLMGERGPELHVLRLCLDRATTDGGRASVMLQMATTMQSLGQSTDAETMLRDAVAIRRRLHGDQHPEVAVALCKLALMLEVSGRHSEAEPLHCRSLEIRRRAFGNEHPSVAESIGCLACLFMNSGNFAKAESVKRAGLEVFRKIYGREHLRIGIELSELAGLHIKLGHHEDAEVLYRESLDIYRKVYGHEHPTLGLALSKSRLLVGSDMQVKTGARQLGMLSVDRKVYGEKHLCVVRSLRGLAELFMRTGRHSDAEPLYREALGFRRSVCAGDHPCVLESLSDLAVVLDELDRLEEVEALRRESLGITLRLHGELHANVAQAMSSLARALGRLGRQAESITMYRKSIGVRRRVYGDEGEDTIQALHNLAVLLQEQGRHWDAQPLFREVALRGKARKRNQVARRGR